MDLRFELTSLRTRIAFYAMLASVLLIAVLTAFQLDALRRDLRRGLDAQQEALVEHVAADIDAKLRQDLEAIDAAADSLTPGPLGTPAALRARFADDAGLLALFDDVFVLDAAGQVIADVPEAPGRTALNAADRRFFQEVLRTGRPVISEPLASKYNREPVINVSAPVRDAAGRVLAVVVGVLRLSKPNALGGLGSARVGRTGYFVLLTRDPDPVYIVHPDRSRILQPRSRFGAIPSTTAALGGAVGTYEDTSTRGVRGLYSPFRPTDPDASAQRMGLQMRQGFVAGEVLRYRKDGSELPLWVSASNVTDEQGRITNFVRVFTDVTHFKESQRRLESLAQHDALTGLSNRRAFEAGLQRAIARARGGGACALLFVDLDAFKAVNDTLGHEQGDELLRLVAARLQSCVRGGDTLCRFGGDEFAVILEGDAVDDDAERVADRMLDACAQPFAVAGQVVHVFASIGIAVYPHDGADEATLVNAADAAMYAAKRAGGNRAARAAVEPLRAAC